MMKDTRSDKIFNLVNSIFMAIIIVSMLYPLYFIVISSFSDPFEVVKGHVSIFPIGWTLEAYQNVFENQTIWIGYRNTFFYTCFGTLFSLFLTIPAAYGLSKKYLPGQKLLNWYFLFTMYFGGGLIPTYLIVRDLGLLNKPYTLIVLGSLSVFNLIVVRIYFMTSIPDSIYEAARIDGSGELHTFLTIALPLATPVIAVMALFYSVSRWNEFMTALIYISSRQLFPLQLVLRGILIQNQTALATIDLANSSDSSAIETAARLAYMAEAMKYSLIFIASTPLLAAYPFVQKYFVKGVMIGSLKG